MFCQNFSVLNFLFFFVMMIKIETERIWKNMLSLHCTESAAAHKMYWTTTLNDLVQPELWTEIIKTCMIIDRVTCPFLPSGVLNSEDSKLCAADGWIDERWEHVTSTLSKLSG